MAAGPNLIRVTGARELRARLKRAERDMGDLSQLHHEVGEIVVDEARTVVPELSGALKGSGRSSTAKTGATVTFGRGPSSAYAGVIHFGWAGHNIEPVPYLFDSLDRRRDEVMERYAEGINKITDRI